MQILIVYCLLPDCDAIESDTSLIAAKARMRQHVIRNHNGGQLTSADIHDFLALHGAPWPLVIPKAVVNA